MLYLGPNHYRFSGISALTTVYTQRADNTRLFSFLGWTHYVVYISHVQLIVPKGRQHIRIWYSVDSGKHNDPFIAKKLDIKVCMDLPY
jgi:hypothetical protein